MKMYLSYEIPGTRTHLFAKDFSHITNTVSHYERSIPSRGDVKEIEHLGLRCELPLCVQGQSLKINLKPDLTVIVNSNAFHPLQRYLTSLENHKRADLFKFTLVYPFVFLLSEDIVNAMKNYNWEIHKKQINQWLDVRDEKIGIIRGITISEGTY